MTSLYPTNSLDIKKQDWRFASEENYIELRTNFKINDIDIQINNSKIASIPSSNCYYSNYDEFDYKIITGTDFVSYDPDTFRFTAKRQGTATIAATHKITGIVINFNIACIRQAIIIIPGILGSELYIGNNNPYFKKGMPLFSEEIITSLSTYKNGDTIEDLIPEHWWEYVTNIPSGIDLVTSWYNSIQCNQNGKSRYDVYVKEYRSEDSQTTSNNCGTLNTYKNLYNHLLSKFSKDYFIDLFSYDWRLSNAESAIALNNYIEKHNYDKVTLIAHSMGGLVASSYIAIGTTQQNKVQTVITLGSPLLGTPVIPLLWNTEDIRCFYNSDSEEFLKLFKIFDVITTIANPLSNLIATYPSIYELFPTKMSFNDKYSNTPYLSTLFLGTNEELITSYEKTKDICIDDLKSYSKELMYDAEMFHDSLYVNGEHILNSVNTYYIAGTDSPSNLYLTPSVLSCSKSEWKLLHWYYGDGVVLHSSATLGDRYNKRTFFASGQNHMGLISPNIYNFISSLLRGNSSTSIHENIYDDLQCFDISGGNYNEST